MKFLKFTENTHTFKIPLSAYVHIFLHLPLFILFPLLSVSPSPKSRFHLCKPLAFALAIQTGSNAASTTLSQMRVQSHTCPSAEECPRMPTHALGPFQHRCQRGFENSVAELPIPGGSEALPGPQIQGGKGLLHFAEPLSTDCNWILGPVFQVHSRLGQITSS